MRSAASALARARLLASVRSCAGVPSSARSVRACCSASSSVGAISAVWKPSAASATAASAATTVLPLPTSPCSRRDIGCGPFKSRAISSHTRSCARVKRKGRRARARATTSARTLARMPGSRTRAARRSASPSSSKYNSSSRSRSCALVSPLSSCARAAFGAGACSARSAPAALGNSRARASASGSVLGTKSVYCATACATKRRKLRGGNPSGVVYTGTSPSLCGARVGVSASNSGCTTSSAKPLRLISPVARNRAPAFTCRSSTSPKWNHLSLMTPLPSSSMASNKRIGRPPRPRKVAAPAAATVPAKVARVPTLQRADF